MKYSLAPRWALLLLLPLTLLANVSYADQVVMKNGDRITGEIQHIWDKQVIIEPELDDDVNVKIDFANIAYIQSDREFEVELTGGLEAIAKFSGADTDGRQLIEIDGSSRAVDLDQLYEAEEVEDYFDWESHIDFNATIQKGNTDSINTKFFAETDLKLGDHRHIANLSFIREEQDGISTAEQDLFRYNYNWLFDDPWFFGAFFSAERDPIKELDQRFIIGTTLGRDFIRTPRTKLNGQLGAGYLTEKNTLGESQQSLVGLWILRYRQDLFSEDLELFHDHSITSYLSGRTNTIIKTTTGARYEITDLLYANISLDYDYETKPALDTAENDDLRLVVGLGLEF
jgi:putative salt-induced outer membrane protein YdiY